MSDSLRDLLDGREPGADGLGTGPTARQGIVARAVDAWTQLMIDTTGRNNLLRYRPLQRGTLELRTADDRDVEWLLKGRKVDALALASDTDVPARARTLYRRAQEHYEERGIDTLHVACGMATWDTTSPWEPCAPIVLLGAKLVPRGALLEGFDLQLTGSCEVNPTLIHVLRAEHGIELDPEAMFERFDRELDEPWELAEALAWFRSETSAVNGMRVEQRRVLGTFAFAKLPMVRDLQGMVEQLAENDIIAAMAGDPTAQAELAARRSAFDAAAPANIDAIEPSSEYLVLDADSTQHRAIESVLAGGNLIIKGPPGTGKSQTISNLIASLAANGKSVLFVAEKRAAIDAVTKRLDQNGLLDLVLDMHGGAGNRRQFASKLRAALDWVHNSDPIDAGKLHSLLLESRDELRVASEVLHEIRTPWGVSLFDAMCEVLASGEEATPLRLVSGDLEALDREAIDACCDELRELVELGGLALDDDASPWRGAPVDTENDAHAAQAQLVDLRQNLLPALRTELRLLREHAGIDVLETPDDLGAMASLVHDVNALADRYGGTIYNEPLADHAATLAVAQGRLGHIWRMLTSSAYRTARAALRSHLVDGARASTPPVTDARALEAVAARWEERASGSSSPQRIDNGERLNSAVEAVRSSVNSLAEVSGSPRLVTADIRGLDQQLAALAADLPTLAKLPRIRTLKSQIGSRGFAALLVWLDTDGARYANRMDAPRMMRGVWARSLVDAIQLSDPRLARISAERLESARERFVASDGAHIRSTADRVRRATASNAVTLRNRHTEANSLLEHQARLKSRHMPIRQLIERSLPALIALKPCWVMSPLVVSQMLPQMPMFDVVIFDEASQIMPHDAVAAIARGRQLVVAGDERQLPPTDFFSGDGGGDGGDGADDGGAAALGFESILDSLRPLLPWRQLGWHYRSQDERLIAFSNGHIYGGTLTTFPGANIQAPIEHVLVERDDARPAQKGSSPAEVERVVELVLQHAQSRPDESLGVIAMGIEHANRIDALLRRELASYPELLGFFDESSDERFFVKNLERVQGDERDAIILSIGYGWDSTGKLPYRFGPLLSEGGERRLNVAVTRSRKRMVVVSSFGAEQMDPSRSSAEGVRLLREFLAYAASGGRNLGSARMSDHPLNPFELDVQQALEQRGLRLHPQHGASGYRIDFAAAHPDKAGSFVLAIECDGASYHSSPSARDRDRLRQEHLERLGWRFHRIWSTDWFHDRDRAADRAVAAFNDAVRSAATAPTGSRSEAEVDVEVPDVTVAPAARGPRPHVVPGAPITQYSHRRLVELTQWVMSDGRLRTDDDLLDELVEVLGYARRGKRIVAALQAAIRDATRSSGAS